MAQYIQLQKNDIQRIANHYGLIVVDFKPIEGGASNSSYVLKTPQNRYVLTVFDEKTVAYVVKLGQLLLFGKVRLYYYTPGTAAYRRSHTGLSTKTSHVEDLHFRAGLLEY